MQGAHTNVCCVQQGLGCTLSPVYSQAAPVTFDELTFCRPGGMPCPLGRSVASWHKTGGLLLWAMRTLRVRYVLEELRPQMVRALCIFSHTGVQGLLGCVWSVTAPSCETLAAGAGEGCSQCQPCMCWLSGAPTCVVQAPHTVQVTSRQRERQCTAGTDLAWKGWQSNRESLVSMP